jgi:hypothetical protein
MPEELMPEELMPEELMPEQVWNTTGSAPAGSGG